MRKHRDSQTLRAAFAWWRARRPSGWSEETHLRYAAVNCETHSEEVLARAIAELIVRRKRSEDHA